MNKSSSPLLYLYLHLLHFLLMNKSSYFQKKKRRKFSKRAFGLGALGSYFLGCFKKKKIINQNFQFHEKIQDFQIFQKKKKEKNFQNFQFIRKIQVFQIQKKKKKQNLH